jgi:hypothetical protein
MIQKEVLASPLFELSDDTRFACGFLSEIQGEG